VPNPLEVVVDDGLDADMVDVESVDGEGVIVPLRSELLL